MSSAVASNHDMVENYVPYEDEIVKIKDNFIFGEVDEMYNIIVSLTDIADIHMHSMECSSTDVYSRILYLYDGYDEEECYFQLLNYYELIFELDIYVSHLTLPQIKYGNRGF